MNKTIVYSVAVVMGVGCSLLVGVSQANSADLEELGKIGALNKIETSMNSGMISMLDGAINSIKSSSNNIMILGVICPKAMLALAAVGTGKLDVENGTRQFLSGLIEDRQEMISASITKNPGVNLAGSDVMIKFTVSKDVSVEDMINIIETGQRFLAE